MNKTLPKVIFFCCILAMLQLSFSGKVPASLWLLVASSLGLFGFWLKQTSMPVSIEKN